MDLTNDAWKLSYKYHRLLRIWGRYEDDIINLVKTNINPAILSKDGDIKENIFHPRHIYWQL